MNHVRDGLIVVSSILVIAGTVPYLIDTIRGKTKPNIVSWLTWTVLTGIGAAAAYSSHAYATAALVGSSGIATGAIVIAGARYGIARYTRFDAACQASAVIGLILWYVFNSPAVATIAVVIIDLIAAVPTYRHAYFEPNEETLSTYVIGTVAVILSIIAITEWSVVSSLYPIYLLLSDGLIIAILIGRRKFIRSS